MDALELVHLPTDQLCAEARRLRPRRLVTYSPKVFIPLTTLCRDVCGYCTFARPPRRGERAYMSLDEVLEIARAGRSRRLSRGALHPRRQAGAPLPGRARGAGGARLRDDARVSGARRAARARGDRAAAPSEPRRDEPRRARRPARGERLDGDHARDRLRSALGQGDASLRLARQAAGAAARDDRRRGRARDPVHDRDPDRDRRDARGAARGAAGDPRARRALRPHPGGDRPELPRQAGHAHGRPPRARPRRAPLDDRRRPGRARAGPSRPGAAEPLLRRVPAPARRRDRRLGRRLAGHHRPRQPGGAVARARRARGGDALARARARAAASRLRGVPGRALARPRGADRDAAPRRRARARARGPLVAGRGRRRAVRRPPRRRAARAAPATSSARTSSCACSRRAATSGSASSPPPTACAGRSAATRSATS